MAAERFVVLGLAPARSPWFRSVGHWATSGALPADFVKCVSAEEVRARLASGRPFSALVADGGLPAVDRDLLACARAADCAPLVVDDGRGGRDWGALGAAAVLAPTFGREALLSALSAQAHMIRRGEADGGALPEPAPAASSWRCPVAAVTGPGGTGASTAAIALAQALADDVRHAGLVLLADFRLHAEQAMLHDARDVMPSVQELVEAHRSGRPSAEEVRALAFSVEDRRYHLLLGLRRARFWAAIRPHAFEAAFDSLQKAYRVIVCDVDADVEGEDAGGSIEVEERHVMARVSARRADVVFVVGLPTMKGVHSLVRVLGELLRFGVPARRLVPVINRSPRSPRARAGLTATLSELMAPALGPPGRGRGTDGTAAPLFLPERRVDEALNDGARLTPGLGAPMAGALAAVLRREEQWPPAVEPELVRPGSLGHWADSGVTNG